MTQTIDEKLKVIRHYLEGGEIEQQDSERVELWYKGNSWVFWKELRITDIRIKTNKVEESMKAVEKLKNADELLRSTVGIKNHIDQGLSSMLDSEIPKMKEVKFKRSNEGKPRYSLLDASFIRKMAESMTSSGYKDNDDNSPNWKNPVDNYERDCLDSLWRHVNDVFEGKFIDPTDGVPTLVKIANNAMICEYQRLKK